MSPTAVQIAAGIKLEREVMMVTIFGTSNALATNSTILEVSEARAALHVKW